MGFLTNVSISNDFLHEIAKDPQGLVEAIYIGMNEGIDGPLHTALSEAVRIVGGPRHDLHVRQATPQGVKVHRARHYDEPQVIVNPYGHHAFPANEISHAIGYGWLDGGEYRRQTAEQTAKLLEDTAADIRRALRKASNA
jgi:hypothetical protein